MHFWGILRPYTDKSVLVVFFMGIASGLPFLLVTSTLSAHLKELGYSNTLICNVTWLTLPYAFKFLWAPIIDSYRIPLLSKILGHRRSWLLLAQILTAFSILILSQALHHHLMWIAGAGLLLCIAAATQDIVYEAFRVESLAEDKQSYGAGAAVVGFRIGMLLSGAFTLLLAEYHGWNFSYRLMSLCMILGVIGSFMAREPTHTSSNKLSLSIGGAVRDFFIRRPWFIILPFIFFFKLGDTIMNTITVIFLTDLGFNKIEIAGVAKTFGISAMIFGGIVGGVLLTKLNLRKTLILSCCLQMISCLAYFTQAQIGYSLPTLYMTMGIENLSCGINQAALIAYLSRLCYQPSTATHFAILSSFSSLARIQLSSFAGVVQHFVGWSLFHLIMAALCIPALLFVLTFRAHFARFSFYRNPFQRTS